MKMLPSVSNTNQRPELAQRIFYVLWTGPLCDGSAAAIHKGDAGQAQKGEGYFHLDRNGASLGENAQARHGLKFHLAARNPLTGNWCQVSGQYRAKPEVGLHILIRGSDLVAVAKPEFWNECRSILTNAPGRLG